VFAPIPGAFAESQNIKLDDVLADIIFGGENLFQYAARPIPTTSYSHFPPHLIAAEPHLQFSAQQLMKEQQVLAEHIFHNQSLEKIDNKQNSYIRVEPPEIAANNSSNAPNNSSKKRLIQDTEKSNPFESLQKKIQSTPSADGIATIVRKERNKEHAKRSRTRKKFLLDSFQFSLEMLIKENDKLRQSIQDVIGPEEAEKEFLPLEGLRRAATEDPLLSCTAQDNAIELADADFGLLQSLQATKYSFIISDPSLPDNPIIFASAGFLDLTGYSQEQVLGRNSRFLQGAQTEPSAVQKLAAAMEEGRDASLCILNYRADGASFWNQTFVGALRNSEDQIVNYLGVFCKVTEEYAKAFKEEG